MKAPIIVISLIIIALAYILMTHKGKLRLLLTGKVGCQTTYSKLVEISPGTYAVPKGGDLLTEVVDDYGQAVQGTVMWNTQVLGNQAVFPISLKGLITFVTLPGRSLTGVYQHVGKEICAKWNINNSDDSMPRMAVDIPC